MKTFKIATTIILIAMVGVLLFTLFPDTKSRADEVMTPKIEINAEEGITYEITDKNGEALAVEDIRKLDKIIINAETEIAAKSVVITINDKSYTAGETYTVWGDLKIEMTLEDVEGEIIGEGVTVVDPITPSPVNP